MDQRKLFATFLISLVVLMAGCKKDDYVDIVGKCPTVVSTVPANLEAGVLPPSKIITATFNEAMNPATITAASFTLRQGTGTPPVFVSGAVTYDENTATMIFTPDNPLSNNTLYTATVKETVKDLFGNALQTDYVWSFITGHPMGPFGVDLQSADRFGILAGTAISNNAGLSILNNIDVGLHPGFMSSITGFMAVDGGPGIINNGSFYAADGTPPVAAMLLQAKNDLTNVYLYTEGATVPAPATLSGDQGGKTLTPGIYKSTSTLLIQSGDLTLDALGEANAVWIFQIASDFTTVGSGSYPSASGGNIILAGGAQAKNVYWQTGSSATIGNYTSFKGNVLAFTSITMGAYSRAQGRMLARNGAVTLTSTNIIDKP
jgi:hypothetical protein